MKNLTATICLAVALLLGSVGVLNTPLSAQHIQNSKSEGNNMALFEATDPSGNVVRVEAPADTSAQDIARAVLSRYYDQRQREALRSNKSVGMPFFEPADPPEDYKTAVKSYRRAAEQGDANAQNNLKKNQARLVSKGIDECLYEEVAKITGPESKKIVEKHYRKKLEKKSLDWLLRYAG